LPAKKKEKVKKLFQTKPDLSRKPVSPSSHLKTLQTLVERYERETGARANQTRLVDFVRWCKENP
jgi:hypothetical protein